MSLLTFKKTPSDCEARCPDCGVTLSRLADMNRHRKTKHPDGTEIKLHCPWSGCGYESTLKGNLKSHVDARHSLGPKYPCPECGRRFTDAAARIRHRKNIHGYVPYHTKEYLARQALNRKERVIQAASKAVSNEDHRQQVACAVPGDLPNGSSSTPPPAPKLPEVAYHDDFWKMPVDTHSHRPQPPQNKARLQQVACVVPGDITNGSSSAPPPAPKLPEVAYHDDFWKMPVDTHSHLPQPLQNKARLQQVACVVPGDITNSSSSAPPPAPKPEMAYQDNFWKMPVDTYLHRPQPPQNKARLQQVTCAVPGEITNGSSSAPPPAPKLIEMAYHDNSWKMPVDTYSHLPQPPQNNARLQQVACVVPGDITNGSSSAPPPAPKLPEMAYHDNFWKMPVDTHSHLPQPLQNMARLQQVACAVPGDITNSLSSAPPPPPKFPEVAYHDDFWKIPVDNTNSYLPQPPQLPLPPPSQDFPLSLPFETLPGYGTHNAIQHFPSAAQLPPPVTLSDVTADYYPDLHDPQLYTIPFQYGESFAGDCGMPPYNWDGQ